MPEHLQSGIIFLSSAKDVLTDRDFKSPLADRTLAPAIPLPLYDRFTATRALVRALAVYKFSRVLQLAVLSFAAAPLSKSDALCLAAALDRGPEFGAKRHVHG